MLNLVVSRGCVPLYKAFWPENFEVIVVRHHGFLWEVQILVVVANIQMRALKSEVGKGSM